MVDRAHKAGLQVQFFRFDVVRVLQHIELDRAHPLFEASLEFTDGRQRYNGVAQGETEWIQ